MGSHMKQAIFEEQTAKALKKWQKAAKLRKKLRKGGDSSPGPGFMSGETTPSQGNSPLHLLHNHKHRSSQPDLESVLNSPRSYLSDNELCEMENSNHDNHPSTQQSRHQHNDASHNNDFSFVKP